jgi:hypothetical protein
VLQQSKQMQQAINSALAAYIAAARAFVSSSEFDNVFAAMYAEDADIIEQALQQYNETHDLDELRAAIAELDDDGAEQVYAYLLKHSHTEALAVLKQ